MNLLPLEILVKGWSPFLEEESRILTLWIIFVSAIGYLLGLLNFQTFIISSIVIILFRKIAAGGFCCSDKKLHGQTIIITGSNSGLGKETARDLARRGASIIMACRDMSKAEKVASEIRQDTGAEVSARKLNLSSFKSIRAFADDILKNYDAVHCLINNAGIMMCPYMETEDGLEMQMGVNHFGHFLLTSLLLPLLTKGHQARIVNVSSLAHKMGHIPFEDLKYAKGYSPLQAYSNSKLANILHARHLAKILKGKNVQVFALHPGVVESELGRHLPFPINVIYAKLFSFVAKTTKEGAQTSIHCALEALQQSPFYFSDCLPDSPSSYSLSDEKAERLWNVSEKVLNLN